jgi:hypothetical protein
MRLHKGQAVEPVLTAAKAGGRGKARRSFEIVNTQAEGGDSIAGSGKAIRDYSIDLIHGQGGVGG